MSDRVDELFSGFEQTGLPAHAAHIVQITGEPGQTHRLHRNCHRIGSTADPEDLMPRLVSVINNAAVVACDEFAVHAAVVANGHRSLALPANTGQGKTTLAAALVQIGFSYLSDEALVLGDNGRAIPYPKPMALSPWSCRALGLPAGEDERLFTASDLGAKAAHDPVDLTDLVVARYGAAETSLEPRPRSVAVAELLAHSFNHYKNPERAFRLTTETARHLRVWELNYDDPSEAAAVLRRELS